MSARDIVTLDDAGRDRFIQENRPSDDGEVFIDLVDMLKDMPKEQLELFIQRVKYLPHTTHAAQICHSSSRA